MMLKEIHSHALSTKSKSRTLAASVMILPLITATPTTAQSSDDRRECIERAQKGFSELVKSLVRSSVMTKGPNDYPRAPEPKAFALCINWDRATSESTFGNGAGFVSGRTVRSVDAAKSLAIANCAEARQAREGHCKCEVVDVNGTLGLKFPRPDWSGGRCK
jgi:hypothetical protein